jgi:hypothetical protein
MLRLAVACTLAAGCAGRQEPAPLARPEETPAALAKPEPDPACHGAVQGLLAKNGLESVTAKLSVDPRGRVELLELLSPDLTPAATIELRRAFESCIWVRPPGDESPEVFTTTWIRERDGR